MNLVVIGEAMAGIRSDDEAAFEMLTGGHEVIGLRNRFAHDYQAIEFDRVWTFVQDHLPLLEREATELRDRYVDEYKIQID